MNDNQIFSLRRFGALAKHEYIINRKTVILCVCALAAVLLTISVLCQYTYDKDLPFYANTYKMDTFNLIVHNTELAWFTTSFYIIGFIFAAGIFGVMNSRDGALGMIVLPASQTEKFLLRWLIAVPCYILLFIVMAMFADWIRVVYGNMAGHADITTIDWTNTFFHPNEAGLFDGAAKVVFFYFVFLQSFFLLGSTVWSRLSFVKTLVSLVVLSLIYAWFGVWVYGMVHTPGYMPGEPFGISEDNATSLLVVTCTVISLFNYGLSYLRFTESEIIKRR